MKGLTQYINESLNEGVGGKKETKLGKVDKFDLVFQPWSKMMGGNGVDGTIRTSPQNRFVANVTKDGKVEFDDSMEKSTNSIDKDAVVKLYADVVGVNESINEGNTEIATTILKQLGGNKFTAMTGSKNYQAGENYLNMKLTKNKAKAQYLTITLTPMDEYDMEFYSMDKNFNKKVKAEVKGVHADQLQEMFTDKTGLYTRL